MASICSPIECTTSSAENDWVGLPEATLAVRFVENIFEGGKLGELCQVSFSEDAMRGILPAIELVLFCIRIIALVVQPWHLAN